MATENIDIRIRMFEEKYAVTTLNDIKKAQDDINRKRLSLKFDISDFQSQAKMLESRIKAISQAAEEGLVSKDYAAKVVANARATLEEVYKAIAESKAEYKDLGEMIDVSRVKEREFKEEIRQRGEAEKEAARQAAEAEAERQRQIEATIAKYDRLADAIHGVSTVLSGLSAASSGVADFADGIANSFGQMANIFHSDVFDTIEKTLTVLATKAFTADMGKVTSRYDIMNTFTDYMELTGVAADEANKALQRVNESILGLPIGLDESAQRLRRYQMFMNDIEAATDLTVGVQKAIVAGGANAQMKNMAYTQIDRLLAAGRLNTAKQWLSLIQGLGVSMRFVTEAMGVTGMSVNDLAAGLTKGDISAQEFLGALQQLGRGGTSAADGLNKALEIYKGTIESWLSNIQFATTRGGETILKSVNQMLQDVSGNGIVDYLRMYRDFLNSMYKGIGNFITGNPRQFGAAVDQIERILSVLQRFNFNDIALEGMDNILKVGRAIESFLRMLPVEDTGKFIAFATTLAGPVRKAMAAFSSGLPAVLGIFNRFKNFNFEILFNKMLRLATIVATVTERILRLIPDSVMSDLLAFGLVLGRPIAGALDGIIGGLNTLENVVRKLAPGRLSEAGGILGFLKELISNNPKILAVVAALTALAAVIGTIAYKKAQYKQSLRDSLGLEEYDAAIRKSDQLANSLRGQQSSWRDNFAAAQHSADGLEELLTKIGNLDTRIHATHMSDRFPLIEQQLDYISQANELYGFNMQLDMSTGLLDENSRALASNAQEVANYIKAVAEAKAAADNLKEIAQERQQNEVEQELLQNDIDNLQFRIDAYERMRDVQKEQNLAASATGGEQNLNAVEDYENQIENLTEKQKEAQEQLKSTKERLSEINNEYNLYMQKATAAASATDTMAKAQGGLQEAIKNVAPDVDELSEHMSKIVEGLNKTYEEYLDTAQKAAESTYGFGKMDPAETEALQTTIDNINSQSDAYEKFIANMDTLQEYLETHKLSESIQSAIGEIASTGLEGSGIIQGLVDQIEAGNDEELKKLGEAYARRATAFSEVAKEQAATQLLAGMKDIVNLALSQAEDGDLFGGALDDAFVKSFTLDDESIDAAAEQVDKTVEMVVEKTEALGNAVKPLAEALSGGVDGEGADSGAESLVAAINTTKEHINGLVEETIPAMMESLGEVKEQVGTFTDETMENLHKKFEETKDESEKLKKEIEKLAAMMASKSSTVSDFANEFDGLASKVNAATEAVQALQAAINSLESKNIDVGANVGGEVVHRASGGFIPHGTDTVPAMLTPGEFVLKRSAAQKIGAPVLNMLNRLDIPSAVDALMSRVARPFSHSFVNYDYRRTYDNHATVNQTIYTDNPSFTYRRASRFAHAL